MHANFCVKRPNGVGVVFFGKTDTQTNTQTDRMKIHAPSAP